MQTKECPKCMGTGDKNADGRGCTCCMDKGYIPDRPSFIQWLKSKLFGAPKPANAGFYRGKITGYDDESGTLIIEVTDFSDMKGGESLEIGPLPESVVVGDYIPLRPI